jgi:hypothetical protein
MHIIYNKNLGMLEVTRRTHMIYKSNLGGEKLGGETLSVNAHGLQEQLRKARVGRRNPVR